MPLFRTTAACALLASAACVHASTFYVDCATGNDSASGTSPSTAWRTLDRVSAYTFSPGDTLQFRRGTTCDGMLAPKGSGTSAAPITLTAWGAGPLPKIQATSSHPAALRLFNQQHWTIEKLELSGGKPHGLLVSGDAGVLHGIRIRNVVVHDVTGDPADKEGGLIVVTPAKTARFEDVEIDGVTAYRTSQWSGILVGAARGMPDGARSANVVIRNAIVHDVAGDGIILFQVNRGLIENSVAWHTGMQETQTIGTPNAIWTWMCRDCVVRRAEAFLVDSPGIDGGAFDIDYGNDNNVVEDSYGHDTQGYCAAVFGAGRVTTNSVIRNNVCTGNGRGIRLARRQGAIYLATWDNGKLDGVRIEGNRIDWHPATDAPVLVNDSAFSGPGVFTGNTVRTSARSVLATNASLTLDRNVYQLAPGSGTRWVYGKGKYSTFEEYRSATGQDAAGKAEPAPGDRNSVPDGSAVLLAVAQNAADARALSVLLRSAERQFSTRGLQAVLVVRGPRDADLHEDLRLGTVQVRFSSEGAPGMTLLRAGGQAVWSKALPVTPGDLGLALRTLLGEPDYSQMRGEE